MERVNGKTIHQVFEGEAIYNNRSILSSRILACSPGRSEEAKVASGAYVQQRLSIFGGLRIYELKGENGTPIFGYEAITGKKRERLFILLETFSPEAQKRIKDFLIWYGSIKKGAECRIVIPEHLFTDQDIRTLVGERWVLNSPPTRVLRGFVNKESFHPSRKRLPPGYEVRVVTEDREAEARELYDSNYKHHSFHPDRLKKRRHKGVFKLSTNRLVSMCGVVSEFYLEGFGGVTIVGDTVTKYKEEEKGFAHAVNSAVFEEAFTGSTPFREPSRIAVFDAFEQTEKLTKRLGSQEVNWNLWMTYVAK